MNFFKIIDKLKRKHTSLLLYCLLDRIPIIVFGDKSEEIDDFIMELSEIIHFRKELVYYTDFISKNEYDLLMQNEDIDYNSQRIQIRCTHNVALKALNQFEDFQSWIIGMDISKKNNDLNVIKRIIAKKVKSYLSISLFSNTLTIKFEGINTKLMDLSLEQDILQKISHDTEKSVTRMKRVLSEKIKLNNLDEELINTLLDFDVEKYELKKNILKKELQNFFSGSKRAFFILTRLNLLNDLEISTKIGSKTLLETIDYEQVPINRITSFINKEWGEDFSNLIENGKKVFIGDKIQSMW